MDFEWDHGNLKEIAKHGISPHEAESVVRNPDSEVSEVYERNGEARVHVVGAAEVGRILVVVYTFRGNGLRVVTAYPATRRAGERHRRFNS